MRKIKILLVEDNEGDILLTKEALSEGGVPADLKIIKDGQTAIEFLMDTSMHQPGALPDMILLDINLPRVNGHEVLKFIKGNGRLKHMPVIILTTSSSETDIELAYLNQANSYITKPSDLHDFFNVIQAIQQFWFLVNRFAGMSIASSEQ